VGGYPPHTPPGFTLPPPYPFPLHYTLLSLYSWMAKSL